MNIRPSFSRVLFVGQDCGTHVAGSLKRAAERLSISARVCDAQQAFDGPAYLRRFHWWFRDRMPPRLEVFGATVLQTALEFKPELMIATGISPMNSDCIRGLRSLGVITANYLTDDPWNKAVSGDWFRKTLAEYQFLFSPRTANLDQLQRTGCENVRHLPFAYDGDLQFLGKRSQVWVDGETDVLFVGECDRDRVPLIGALLSNGINVKLYGNRWDRHAITRRAWRGRCDAELARASTYEAKVALCVHRKANRDGHTMRAFEIAAQGGCMLAEYSEELEAIFGPDGDSVVYFRTAEEMVRKAIYLIGDLKLRQRLSLAIHGKVMRSHHSYDDRLRFMLDQISEGSLDRFREQ